MPRSGEALRTVSRGMARDAAAIFVLLLAAAGTAAAQPAHRVRPFQLTDISGYLQNVLNWYPNF